MTVANLSRALLQGVAFVVTARGLGAERYGVFVALVALASFASPFALAGLQFVAARDIAQGRTVARDVIGRGWRLYYWTMPPVLLLMLVFAHGIVPAATWLILALIIVAEVCLAPVIDFGMRVHQAHEEMNFVAGFMVAPAATRALAASGLVVLDWRKPEIYWAVAYFSCNLIVAVAALWILYRRFGFLGEARNRNSADIRDGIQFAWNITMDRANADLDKALLAHQRGTGSAGVYGAAYRVVEVAMVPLSSLIMSANASLYRLGLSGADSLRRVTHDFLPGFALYGAFSVGALYVAAPVVPHLLGEGYAGSEHVVRWLAILPVLLATRVFLGLSVTAIGRLTTRSAIQTAGVLLNAICNVGLIPAYGWVGAAIATLVAEACMIAALGLVLFRAA